MIMQNFSVPTKDQVSTNNQTIFDNLQKGLGFVPNLYAYIAKNDTALGDYLVYQNRKSSLTAKEKEVVNLVTSQINGCAYCLAAHTAIGKMNGFTDEQILGIRAVSVDFDSKIEAMALLTRALVNGRGKVAETVKEQFFNAGYSEANFIDVVIVISDITVTNYVHNFTQVPVDFPAAVALEAELV
jgi:uncharacterized peroxidase-related enzyme